MYSLNEDGNTMQWSSTPTKAKFYVPLTRKAVKLVSGSQMYNSSKCVIMAIDLTQVGGKDRDACQLAFR